MEKWTPITKNELLMEIYFGEQNMDEEILLFWNQIKMYPEVWTCADVIQENFWVVAKHINFVVWYNDFEEGFNISKYKEENEIKEYGAEQDELNFAIIKLKNRIESV